jgi:hypothetical protein
MLPPNASSTDLASAQHAGDWQTTPSYLQVVPPGGTFCGSVDAKNAEDGGMLSFGAFITTDLWGQDLYNFYSPVLTKANCTSTQPDPRSSQIKFMCPPSINGFVEPDTGFQYIGVTTLPP